MLRGTARKIIPATIRGAEAYAAGSTARIQCADITPFGAKQTYISGIELCADVLMQHAAGGPVLLPEELAYRIFERIQWRVPGGHVFLDLGQQAGCALYNLLWALTGRRPHSQGGGGNISLTNGTTTAVRVKLFIPAGYLAQGIKPDDANIALEDVIQSAIEVTWANGAIGGVFDSGGDNENVASGTLKAQWHLVGREDEYRVAPYMSIVTYDMSGADERLPIAGEVLHHLVELPVHADGITVDRITDAERDLVTLIADGEAVVDRVDARDLQPSWNEFHANSRDDELPHHEGNASPWVSIFCPKMKPYQLTHLIAPLRDPQLRLTGTRTTPRIAWVTTSLRDQESTIGAVQRAGKMGVPVPMGFGANPQTYLEPKTASKTNAFPGPEVSQRLPWKVEPRPEIKAS